MGTIAAAAREVDHVRTPPQPSTAAGRGDGAAAAGRARPDRPRRRAGPADLGGGPGAGRAGAAAPAGRLPVRVAYQPGAAHRALPGVTVTSTAGDVATGYLTAGSARAFGQALAAQVRADRAAGWPRRAGLFAGVSSVRYGGTVTPVVQPRFPMVTLRIRVLDGQGQPTPFGSVTVLNVDDQRKYQGFGYTDENGEIRVSVPVGNYSLMADVLDFADDSYTWRLVTVTDDPAVLQHLQLTIDALVSVDVMPFWRAVLGYLPVGDEDLVDPHARGPALWFQDMDAPRPQRNRIHPVDPGLRRPGARAGPRLAAVKPGSAGWSAPGRTGAVPAGAGPRTCRPATDRPTSRPRTGSAGRGTSAPAGPSRSWWRTTTRPRRPTSRSTGRPSGCRRARPPAAASAR